jgi:hypothetical protein
MAKQQSLNRQIKRNHIQVEVKTEVTECGFVNDPILGVKWISNIKKVLVKK